MASLQPLAKPSSFSRNPLHSAFKGALIPNEPVCGGTVLTLHEAPSANRTNLTQPTQSACFSTSNNALFQGAKLLRKSNSPLGWNSCLYSNTFLTTSCAASCDQVRSFSYHKSSSSVTLIAFLNYAIGSTYFDAFQSGLYLPTLQARPEVIKKRISGASLTPLSIASTSKISLL